jgi:hypothetical protein
MIRRAVIPIMAAALCSSCYMPPSRLEEMPLLSRSFEVQLPPTVVVHNFEQGLRYCAPHGTDDPVDIRYALPDCGAPQPDGAATCYLYRAAEGGRLTRLVIGKANFRPLPGGTTAVELRVLDFLVHKDEILQSWRQFLHGKERDVCLPPVSS